MNHEAQKPMLLRPVRDTAGGGLKRLRAASCALGLLLLGACQTPPVSPSATPALPGRPAAPPLAAAATRYAIRSELSDLRFLVYRAGALAHLGHNHVIQARTIEGEIDLADDFPRSRFSLSLPVADFAVDAPAARAVEGEDFAQTPEADAIAGTRRNMLGEKVLDAARFPRIDIGSVRMRGPPWAPDVTLRITLHGVAREISVPVAIVRHDGRLVATAVFEVKQSDFGITPLSVFGGALAVADRVKVRMRVVALKAPSQAHRANVGADATAPALRNYAGAAQSIIDVGCR